MNNFHLIVYIVCNGDHHHAYRDSYTIENMIEFHKMYVMLGWE